MARSWSPRFVPSPKLFSPKPMLPSHPLRHLLVALVLLSLTCLITLSTRLAAPVLPRLLQRSTDTDFCAVIGSNPRSNDVWQYNSRSLCVTSHVCVGHNRLDFARETAVKCAVLSGEFEMTRGYTGNLSCEEFRRKRVWCAHGRGLRDDVAKCPEVGFGGGWGEEVGVVVPFYPWPWNIFHFVNVVADLHRVMVHLERLVEVGEGVVIVMQRPRRIEYVNGSWQRELMELFVGEWSKWVDVRVVYVEEVGGVCLKRAVMMGNRGSAYLWPFLNETEVDLEGRRVPKDAVRFRRVVYDALGVGGVLPGEGRPDLPPLVVGYAQRNAGRGGDGFYRWGGSRRFSEGDERWFVDMLRNETVAVGGEFVKVAFGGRQNLSWQVGVAGGWGMMVGIHGANLVNAVFMRPRGVLMEILPNGFESVCYWGGMNSGLKYLKFEAGKRASVVDSGCEGGDRNCGELRQRRVVLEGEDRWKVRLKVREGLRYLKEVREGRR